MSLKEKMLAALIAATPLKNAVAQNTPDNDKESVKTERIQQAETNIVDGSEVYYGGIAAFTLGIGDKDLQVKKLNNGEAYFCTSDKGCAYITAGGDRTISAILEEDNTIHYYYSGPEVKGSSNLKADHNLSKILRNGYKQYGKENSSFALKMQENASRETIKEQMKAQTPKTAENNQAQEDNVRHTTKNGVTYTFTQDGKLHTSGNVSTLRPTMYYNAKNKRFTYGNGAVQSYNQSTATAMVDEAIRLHIVKNDIELRMENGEQISQSEQSFLESMKKDQVTAEKLQLKRGQDGALVQTNPILSRMMQQNNTR